jgi:hypothetical protein
MKISRIVESGKAARLSGLAITDHNTVAGLREASRVAESEGTMFVPGVEVSTDYGDVLGLFVTDNIRTRDAYEVLDVVRHLGGMSVLAHPFKTMGMYPCDLLSKMDGVEVLNSRNRPENIAKAVLLAKMCSNLRMIASSDAHFYFEIGRCRTIMDEDIVDLEGLRKGLLSGRMCLAGRVTPRYVEYLSQFVRVTKEGSFLRAFSTISSTFAKFVGARKRERRISSAMV